MCHVSVITTEKGISRHPFRHQAEKTVPSSPHVFDFFMKKGVTRHRRHPGDGRAVISLQNQTLSLAYARAPTRGIYLTVNRRGLVTPPACGAGASPAPSDQRNNHAQL